MAYILRSSTVIRRHWFSGVVTGTPTAQLYVGGVASGGPLVGTGADDAWTFSVPVGALAFGTSVEIWAAGLVSAVTERVKLVDGFIADTAESVGGATIAEVERVDGMLAAVKAKTDLISVNGVLIQSPVRTDGTLADLIVGDAYQLAAGRAIVITMTDVTAGLQTILNDVGATVHLGFLRFGKSRQNPDFRRYEFPGTIVSVGASTVVRFELTTAQTLGIVPSKYDYDIEFRQNANFVTSVKNAKGKPMEWLESATELA